MTISTATKIARQQHINLARQGKVDARDSKYLAVHQPKKGTFIGAISID